MASVAAATDRPELGTGWVGALAHEQDLLGMCGHACPKRDWTTTAGSCEAKPHLQVVASPAGGRLQTRPRSPITIGVFLVRSRRESLNELTDVSHRLRSLRRVSPCAGPLRGPALAKRDRGPFAGFAPSDIQPVPAKRFRGFTYNVPPLALTPEGTPSPPTTP